eukprot:jgi/Chrzof1/11579/Cz06g00270.t1
MRRLLHWSTVYHIKQPYASVTTIASSSPASWFSHAYRRLRAQASRRPKTSMSAQQQQDKWWDSSTVAVVTGANKGIGFDVARLLAEAGMTVVITARDETRGMEAAEKLKALKELSRSNLVFHQLDIADKDSIAAFADWATKQFGRVDILVNNAGIAFKGNIWGAEEASVTLHTNYQGTVWVCETLKHLIPPGGRIVNVTSSAGLLSIIPDQGLRAQIENPASKQALGKLADKFVDDIRQGRHNKEGWPNSMYGVSKCLENAYTRLLAEELKPAGVMVNACHPG